MRTTTRLRRRVRLLGLAAIGVVAIALWQVLFDPLALLVNAAGLARIRAELPAAEALWRAQGISDYDIEVQLAIALLCRVSAELSVRGGELVAVAMRQDPSDPSSPLVPVEAGGWDSPGCAYEDLTVARVFETVERHMEEISVADTSLHVAFDDERGFVTEYSYSVGYRRGLLNPQVMDAWVWFSFENLRPIASP